MNGAIFIILLGPGEREFQRFMFLMDSLRHFEREHISRSALIVVSDNDSNLRANVNSFGFKEVAVFDNPFVETDRESLVYDRITAGFLRAMQHVLKMDGYEFVIKIDPDALACGPFAERIKSFFASHPDIGMIGSFRHDPDGALRTSKDWWARSIRRTCGLLPSQWIRFHLRNRLPFHFPLTIKRWKARYLLMRKALSHGWSCGDNISGGAYALSPLTIDAFRSHRGLFDDVFQFEGTRLSDDLTVSMHVAAAGFRLGEFNRPGEVFGIWYQRPTLPIKTLIESGYGLVHSVKDADPLEEIRIRTAYAQALDLPTAPEGALAGN